MASIKEITAALAEAIQDATGLRSTGYIPPSINPPTCAVTIGRTVPGSFALGQLDLELTVYVFTSKADDRSGQLAMYDYMSASGERSVWRAIYNAGDSMLLPDTSIGLREMRPMTFDEVASIGYFGVVFEVVGLTSGA